MRYISRMSYDHKTFATAIVNLAVKGVIDIVEKSKKYELTQNYSVSAKLSAGEEVLTKRLFSKGDTIKLENSNHHIIQKSIEQHKKSLKLDYQKLYFKLNSVWLIPAVLSSILLLVIIFPLDVKLAWRRSSVT